MNTSTLTFNEYVTFCHDQGWTPVMTKQEFDTVPILKKFAEYQLAPPDPQYQMTHQLKMSTIEKCVYSRWDYLRCSIEDACASRGLTVDPGTVNRALGKRLFLQAEWMLTREGADLSAIIELISNDIQEANENTH